VIAVIALEYVRIVKRDAGPSRHGLLGRSARDEQAKKQKPVRSNPHARELAQPKYRQRVAKDKRRRERKPVKIEIEAENA
jgi:hypothetical protein